MSPWAWRIAKSVTGKRAALSVAFALLALSAAGASACSTIPPKVTPDPRDVVKTADLVAIVRIERFEPLTAEQEAELQRLLNDPPLDTPFRYPAPGLHFSTLRVLKGRMPADALIQNGATSCDVLLAPGHDYVLFARLTDNDGARIYPLDGTFYLGNTERDQAVLADVELSLSSSKPTP